MKKIGLILSVLAMGLAIGGYVFFNGERREPVQYRTVAVEQGPIVSMVSATGTINPVVLVEVGTQVSGMIKGLHADFNSRVKAGETVAVIDPEPFKARREQAVSNLEVARSNVARARADLAQRKRELERVQSLLPQQFVAQNDVDVAITNYESAEAQVRVAEAQVRQAGAALNAAEQDLKYTDIRSPIDGVVVARNVEVGQTVAASFATPNLFLIARDLTQMQVNTNVSESDIGGMAERQEAVFTVDAYPGESFRGTIRQVRLAPINVQNVVTYNVVVGVDNKDLRLKPGMTANVSIVVAQKAQALKVPNAALRFAPPKGEKEGQSTVERKMDAAEKRPVSRTSEAVPAKTVWKMGDDGNLNSVSVDTGISDGMATEIISGSLREGELVVVGIEQAVGTDQGNELPPGFGNKKRPRYR